jgi:hypothetical protein
MGVFCWVFGQHFRQRGGEIVSENVRCAYLLRSDLVHPKVRNRKVPMIINDAFDSLLEGGGPEVDHQAEASPSGLSVPKVVLEI